jgi:hypothetical protein
VHQTGLKFEERTIDPAAEKVALFCIVSRVYLFYAFRLCHGLPSQDMKEKGQLIFNKLPKLQWGGFELCECRSPPRARKPLWAAPSPRRGMQPPPSWSTLPFRPTSVRGAGPRHVPSFAFLALSPRGFIFIATLRSARLHPETEKAGRGNSYLGGNETERSLARALTAEVGRVNANPTGCRLSAPPGLF